MNHNRHNFLEIACIVAAILAMTWGIYRNFFQITQINLVFYATISNYFDLRALLRCLLFAFGVSVLTIRYAIAPESRTPAKIAPALLPLLLCGVDVIFPPGIYSPLLLIAGCSWTALRLFPLLRPMPQLPCMISSSRTAPVIVYLVIALFIAMGYLLQWHAHITQFSGWGDWGIFLEFLHNTCHGRWFQSNYLDFINHMGVHFSPILIFLLPAVALMKGPEPFFLLNSIILFGSGIVIYLIARSKNYPAWTAATLALLYCLYPGITNLNLTLIYGFHEENFLMALLPAAWYFMDRRNWYGFTVMLILSLFVKETVAVWWCGLAVVLLLRRQWRLGLILLVTGICYFIVAQKLVMPSLLGKNEYSQFYRFNHLGGSMLEVALSPILHPTVFFAYLFRPGNIYYILTLLAPWLIIVLLRPVMLLAPALTLIFSCVQASDQLQNIMMQYQCSFVAAMIICLFEATDALRNGAGNSRWLKFLLRGCSMPLNDRLRKSVLAATAVSTALAFYFFANTWFTVNTVSFSKLPDCRDAIEQIKSQIPSGATLTTSYHLAPCFIIRNDIYHELDHQKASRGLGEYVLLDLSERFNGKMFALRDYLLQSPEYKLISYIPFEQHLYLLFRRGNGAAVSLPQSVYRITDTEWQDFGSLFPSNRPDVSIKLLPPDHAGNMTQTWAAAFRLQQPSPLDYMIIINVSDKTGQAASKIIYWGNGLIPQNMRRAGDTYITPLPQLPQPSESQQLSIILKERS